MARLLASLALVASLGAAGAAHAAPGSATYTYDALGRLTQVTYDTGTTIVFTYDAVGNRTSRVITLGP